jgi:hypothetical protein
LGESGFVAEHSRQAIFDLNVCLFRLKVGIDVDETGEQLP